MFIILPTWILEVPFVIFWTKRSILAWVKLNTVEKLTSYGQSASVVSSFPSPFSSTILVSADAKIFKVGTSKGNSALTITFEGSADTFTPE